VGRLQSVGDGLANGRFVVHCENTEFLFHAPTCASTRAGFRPNADDFSGFLFVRHEADVALRFWRGSINQATGCAGLRQNDEMRSVRAKIAGRR
jgi:hypothetical protein